MLPMHLLLAGLAGALEGEYSLPGALRGPLYDVQWLTTPTPLAGEQIHLVDHGINLICALPSRDAGAGADAAPALAPAPPPVDPETFQRAVEAVEYLQRSAIVTRDDTWGWSVVFNASVVQFKPFASRDYSWFRFDSEGFFAAAGQTETDVFKHAKPATIGGRRAVRVEYTFGTMCEIVNRRRRLSMFFVCDEGAEVFEPRMLSITEPHTCHYEMVFGVKELCQLQEYSEPVDEVPVNLVNTITCAPAPGLQSDIYMQYAEAIKETPLPPNDEEMSFVGLYPRMAK